MKRRWLHVVVPALAAAAWGALDARLAPPVPPQLLAGLHPRAAGPASSVAAPSSGVRPTLQAALRNPFGAELPASVGTVPSLPTDAPAPRPASTPPPKEAAAPLEAQPPSAPPLDLQFTGRMSAPDGSHLVFARQGANVLVLKPGILLPNGYRVDAIEPGAVQLSYPPLNTTARLELPAAPAFELR